MTIEKPERSTHPSTGISSSSAAFELALVHLPMEGEMTPNPKLLCDDRLATDGSRASGRQHPVQHRHADGSLGLLSGEAAGSQPWSDQRLVATHCRFDQGPLAVIGCCLPSQIVLVP